MGWLTMTRRHMGVHATPKAYLDAQFTYAREIPDGTTRGLRVIRSAYVDRVYYAACEPFTQADDSEVADPIFAVVCLTRWTPNARDGHVFGYKDLSEQSGPNESRCPQSVLALLGPTTDHHALDWRRRCLATIERRSRHVADGDRIRLAAPLRFTDGYEGDEFTVKRCGRSVTRIAPNGRRYRLSHFAERDWSVIPTTKIHAPVFADRS